MIKRIGLALEILFYVIIGAFCSSWFAMQGSPLMSVGAATLFAAIVTRLLWRL